ncbi:MAG TPA: energy-coupling factor transporter transmembrane component T [Actinomycetes bacterium]|nr:energy-coupling factor transporter transmembrane component T [Actinomycetes bacterium]
MSVATAHPREVGTTWFTRSNALARLAPAVAFGIVNVVTLDLATPILTLAIVTVALPVTGLSLRQAARATWPLFAAAATLVAVNTLAYPSPGVSSEDFLAGLTTGLRLLAIALPGVLAFATIDAVDLTDALVQQLHISPRFGYGALAALRLMPLLGEDWRSQSLAARARGVAPRGAVARIRNVAKRILGLLVTAVRRATRLATALDARGFDGAKRATARPSAWTRTDTALTIASAVLGGLVVWGSVALGVWDPLLGG